MARCIEHPKCAIRHIEERYVGPDCENLPTHGFLHVRALMDPKGSFLMGGEHHPDMPWDHLAPMRFSHYASGGVIVYGQSGHYGRMAFGCSGAYSRSGRYGVIALWPLVGSEWRMAVWPYGPSPHDHSGPYGSMVAVLAYGLIAAVVWPYTISPLWPQYGHSRP